jgi:hypothetical protein
MRPSDACMNHLGGCGARRQANSTWCSTQNWSFGALNVKFDTDRTAGFTYPMAQAASPIC